MILIDENLPEAHRLELVSYGIPVRQVGFEWGRKGFSDDEILSALRGLRRVTFLTLDIGFYKRVNCHPNYSLALFSVPPSDLPGYAVRFLKHRHFRTYASRQGKVFRVQPTGIVYWERKSSREIQRPWS